ncbi:sugar phosphate nucleotidyltransferase [Vibrio chagasii]|nr:sugar phosphate nucleotidyltransferase [Vibrio chagasii]
MEIDESLQINNFTEKPRYPACGTPELLSKHLTSMGIYVFDKVLTQALLADAEKSRLKPRFSVKTSFPS